MSEIGEGGAGAVRMTSEMGFESAGGVPAFWSSMVSAPAAATSEGCSVMVQVLDVGQFVVRGELLTRSCDVPLLVVARKLRPSTARRKLL